jgi:hypothetical protein
MKLKKKKNEIERKKKGKKIEKQIHKLSQSF